MLNYLIVISIIIGIIGTVIGPTMCLSIFKSSGFELFLCKQLTIWKGNKKKWRKDMYTESFNVGQK